MKFMQYSLFLLGVTVIMTNGASSEEFQAGIAVRDITPRSGLNMWGYMDRTGPAKGALDPLYARAIVFRVGDYAAALVSLDLGRPPVAEAVNRIRNRVREAGVDHVMLVATHTHHGPYMEFSDEPYAKRIEELISDAIMEAARNVQSVRLGLGKTEIDIAHNRRKHLPDGRVLMMWRNEERVPTSPVDKEATVIKVEDANGKLIAALVHYACHPVAMDGSNLEYSADYVGEMARIIKEATGAECIFLQGACGDINPYLDKTPISKGGVETMKSVGRAAAYPVLAELEAIRARAPESPSIAAEEEMVEVGVRWDLDSSKQVEALRNTMGDRYYEFYIANRPEDLSVPLSVLLLNDDIAFAGMPGEIFVQYQLQLKEQSPVENTLLLGYTNEYHAYFPTIRDAAAGGYGANVGSYVGLGAADKLTMQAQITIGKLAGKFKDYHPPADFKLVERE